MSVQESDAASDAKIQELRQKIQAAMESQGSNDRVEEEAPQQSWWARYGLVVVTILVVAKLVWRFAQH